MFMQQRIEDISAAFAAANLPPGSAEEKAFSMLKASCFPSTLTFAINAMVSVPAVLAALDIQKRVAASECPLTTTSQVVSTNQTASSTTFPAQPSPQNASITLPPPPPLPILTQHNLPSTLSTMAFIPAVPANPSVGPVLCNPWIPANKDIPA